MLGKSCKRLLWLEKRRGIKLPPSPMPTITFGIDRVAKAGLDDHRMKGEFSLAKVFPNADISVIKGLSLFDNFNRLQIWRDFRKGLELVYNGVLFRGAIDDLLVNERGQFVPFDIKTRGFLPTEETIKYYQLQMDAYTLLLERNGFPVANFAVLGFWIPVDAINMNTISFEVHLVRVPVNPNNAITALQDAIDCINGQEPDVCELCKYVLQNNNTNLKRC